MTTLQNIRYNFIQAFKNNKYSQSYINKLRKDLERKEILNEINGNRNN